jgi:hypothetical protein
MKIIFTAIILLTIATISHAQITITNTSFPNAGDLFIVHNDTLISAGITPGGSGANQNWDFSALHSHILDTSKIVSAASTPYAANFPSATLALTQDDSTFNYITKNSTQLNVIGFAGPLFMGTIMSIPFTSPLIFRKHGVTAASYYNFTTSFSAVIDGAVSGGLADSIKITNEQNITRTIDGWGTVTTPKAASVPCLKQIEYNITTTDIDIKSALTFGQWVNFQSTIDTSQSFEYIDNYNSNAVASLGYDLTTSTVTSASFRHEIANGVFNTIQKPTLFTVFPNPTNQNTTLVIGGIAAGVYTINLMDIIGKNIQSNTLTLSANNTKSIDYSISNAGLYMVQLIAPNGQVVQTIKLDVTK